jgi:hypothetical protein
VGRLNGRGTAVGRDYLQEDNIRRAQMEVEDPDNVEDYGRHLRTYFNTIAIRHVGFLPPIPNL